ncbi:hypothetical protein C0Q70_03437 [Pomacea canaliculata]|uniref:RING-type domain-containing protein n=1 Tax=Pomacea canaliculata TaxID=400727 RepID=A0A2T7PSN9_POMCA|nr:hypothetical protein C0Q70_03437 [Pomacea canaliculata]
MVKVDRTLTSYTDFLGEGTLEALSAFSTCNMSDSGFAVEKDSLVCAVCTEVYRSPRFLPCYHTFCLPCLEELANRHGSILPCPTCRASVPVPPGGVSALQVNFYMTEEALEWARSEDLYSTCPVHTKQHVIFYCTQCDQAICMRCKLTKHEGHVTDDLSDAAVRCKKTVEEHLHRLDDSIQVLIEHAEAVVKIEERAKEKRDAVAGQVGF